MIEIESENFRSNFNKIKNLDLIIYFIKTSNFYAL